MYLIMDSEKFQSSVILMNKAFQKMLLMKIFTGRIIPLRING
jgi:hypothetical protein